MTNTREMSIVLDEKNLIRKPRAMDRYARAEGLIVYWKGGDAFLEIEGNILYRFDQMSQSYEILKKNIAGAAESSYDHWIINRDAVSYIDFKGSLASKDVFESA